MPKHLHSLGNLTLTSVLVLFYSSAIVWNLSKPSPYSNSEVAYTTSGSIASLIGAGIFFLVISGIYLATASEAISKQERGGYSFNELATTLVPFATPLTIALIGFAWRESTVIETIAELSKISSIALVVVTVLYAVTLNLLSTNRAQSGIKRVRNKIKPSKYQHAIDRSYDLRLRIVNLQQQVNSQPDMLEILKSELVKQLEILNAIDVIMQRDLVTAEFQLEESLGLVELAVENCDRYALLTDLGTLEDQRRIIPEVILPGVSSKLQGKIDRLMKKEGAAIEASLDKLSLA